MVLLSSTYAPNREWNWPCTAQFRVQDRNCHFLITIRSTQLNEQIGFQSSCNKFTAYPEHSIEVLWTSRKTAQSDRGTPLPTRSSCLQFVRRRLQTALDSSARSGCPKMGSPDRETKAWNAFSFRHARVLGGEAIQGRMLGGFADGKTLTRDLQPVADHAPGIAPAPFSSAGKHSASCASGLHSPARNILDAQLWRETLPDGPAPGVPAFQ